jgi:hypothetical protein
MVRFLKLEYPVLAKHKLSWLKKIISPREDVDDDNDDTDDEYDDQELLVEFKKLISKHMKLKET